jgi:hypothetical protein
LLFAACGGSSPINSAGKKIAELLCQMPAAENDTAKLGAIAISIDKEADVMFADIVKGKKISELSGGEKAQMAQMQVDLAKIVREEAKKCGLTDEQLDLYFSTGGMKKVNFDEVLAETKGITPMKFKSKHGNSFTEIYTLQTPEKTIVWEVSRDKDNQVTSVDKVTALNATIEFCTVSGDTPKDPNTDGSYVAYEGAHYNLHFCPDRETCTLDITKRGKSTTKEPCLTTVVVPFSTLEQGQAFVNHIKAQKAPAPADSLGTSN